MQVTPGRFRVHTPPSPRRCALSPSNTRDARPLTQHPDARSNPTRSICAHLRSRDRPLELRPDQAPKTCPTTLAHESAHFSHFSARCPLRCFDDNAAGTWSNRARLVHRQRPLPRVADATAALTASKRTRMRPRPLRFERRASKPIGAVQQEARRPTSGIGSNVPVTTIWCSCRAT